MNNPRMTKKELGLLKGAIRRVFSRSDLRRAIINLTIISHIDPLRPRVKKWSMCQSCLKPTPTYQMQLDHKDPIIPVDKSLEVMTWDEVIDRVWCEENNLTPLCKKCHLQKSSQENKLRRANKKKGPENARHKTIKRTSKASRERTSSRGTKR